MSSAAPVGAKDAGAEDAGAAKPRGRRKLVLLAVPVALGLLGAGGWFSGLLPKLLGMDKKAEAPKPAGPPAPVFVDLPEIIANLNVGGRRASYVKLKAKLEIPRAEELPAVQAAMPRILDLFQTYLRDMRPEDLRGSAGTYRLREELIARGTIAVAPAHITDVLFTEMLVQ